MEDKIKTNIKSELNIVDNIIETRNNLNNIVINNLKNYSKEEIIIWLCSYFSNDDLEKIAKFTKKRTFLWWR